MSKCILGIEQSCEECRMCGSLRQKSEKQKGNSMRKILFRGKRVDNGEWITGDLIITPFIRNETRENIPYILDVTEADYDCFEDLTEENGIFEVEPETVCQYTGMYDNNGKKIFEGDIVKFENCSNYPIFWDSDYCAFGSCWYSDFDHLSKYRNTKMEVVGNIFDNPELLED